MTFNMYGVAAIYRFEMARFMRTIWQSLVTPVITTSLYFVVFGSAIGGRMQDVGGVPYAAFIVPGLMMMTLFTEGLFNGSFGIYFPKFIGTIYELLSAPISTIEVIIGYVGAAATKSVVLGLIAVTFALFGFILGIWANSFEQLNIVPMLIMTPLTFLGGAFYSIEMLPPAWQTITLFNPVVYIISVFRWSFFGLADVNVALSLSLIIAFLAACLVAVGVIFKTGYRLKN